MVLREIAVRQFREVRVPQRIAANPSTAAVSIEFISACSFSCA